MKKTLEMLWKEYFAEKCATIDTEEEKSISRNTIEMRKKAAELLTKEQNDAIEKYVDALCQMQSAFVKKAFFLGCEFTASFLLEAGNFLSRSK